MLKVILLGHGELASAVMLGITESRHKLVGVLRWEKVTPNPISLFFRDLFIPDNFYSLIKAYKIPEIKANSANSEKFIKEALKLNPDVIIVASWGEKLKEPTIILPQLGCINCHPSLLPVHRGSNPYASVIREGNKTSGISFHLIDKNFDTGPILLQKEESISEDDTGYSLRIKLSKKARETVKELLDGIENARYLPRKQDESKASYFPALDEDDAVINWNQSAQDIHNRIRGLYPWIKCYSRHKDQFLLFSMSKIVELENPVYKAGTILSKTRNSLTVSTADPHKAVILEGIEVFGFLSFLWTGYYLNKRIKTGDILVN